MASLIQTPNLDDQDGFYADLLQAHAPLNGAESAAFNARLILILANHVGDREALAEALSLASETG